MQTSGEGHLEGGRYIVSFTVTNNVLHECSAHKAAESLHLMKAALVVMSNF